SSNRRRKRPPQLRPPQQVPAELGRVVRRRQRLCLLSLLALAAGEVEIGLELALLAHKLRLEQHEVVRLEQLAEVDIGERPCVRRVAGPLEGVQLARRKWA